MSEIVSKCDVCGSQHLKKFVDWKTNNTVLSYVICTSCGLVFLSPRPSSHDLENYYLADYRVEQQGTELPTDQKVDFERRRTIHLLQVIESHIPVIDVHLDIGCAAGELIIAVKKLYGCTSYGIEPSIAYRTYLDTELGIPTFPTLPDYIQSTTLKRKVDLVSMIHVLEHIPDPICYLTHLRSSILKDNGYLLIEVPNLLVHTSFEPSHLYAFSENALELTLKKSGFEIVNQVMHGHPRSDPRKHYITALAQAKTNRSLTGHDIDYSVRPLQLHLRRRINRSTSYFVIRHPWYVFRRTMNKLQHK